MYHGPDPGLEAEPTPAARGRADSPAGDDAPEATAKTPLTRAHLSVVGLVTLAALAVTILVLWNAQPSDQSVPLSAHASSTPAPTSTPPATAPALPPAQESNPVPDKSEQATEVVVHVVGKVRQPGVFRLDVGSRVIDAIEAAGGAHEGEPLTGINLARALHDGEQVRVGLPPDPNVNLVNGYAGPPGTTGAGRGGTEGPVDLNAATEAELESLPGVGPVLSQRIAAYRAESGPFRTVDQLIEVSGIGPAMLERLRDLVRV